MLPFDDRETSRNIANMFADASPKLRRCIGDVMRLFLTSGDIASAAKKINACIEIFRDALPRFCLKKGSAMHRRCIAECSAMLPRTLINKFYFPKHPRGTPMHRRSIRDASGMHPRIFVKHIWGIWILRSRAVHTCVDTIHASRKLVSFYIADVFSLVGP